MEGRGRRLRVRLARRLLIGAAACLLGATPPAIATDLHSGALPNGLEYVIAEDHSRPRVAVSGCFRIGPRTEQPGERGLTHFIEHLIGRGGTETQTEAEWRTVRSRLDYAAYTSRDGSCYEFEVSPEELGEGLERYAHGLFELEVTAASVSAEREVVLQELLRGLDMPFGPESHRLWPTAFERHPYRTLTIGREDLVRAANAETLRRLHAERFRPNQLFLAVVGAVESRKAESLVSAALGAYRAGAPSFELNLREPEQHRYREVVLSGEPGRSRFLLGCKSPPASHADAPALDVAGRMLAHGSGSRLAAALVDAGTARSVSATPATTRDPGLFVFELETATGQEARALAGLWRILLDLARDEIPREELRRAQRSIRVDRALARESLRARARGLSEAELAGSHTLEASYPHRLRAVTTKEVTRAVARYLHPDRCSLVASVETPESESWMDLAAATVADWPRSAGPPSSTPTVRRSTLANGATLLVEERPQSSTLAFELLFGGPREAPHDQPGVARVAATALALQPVAGTTLEQVVGSLGGHLRTEVTADFVSLSAELLAEDLPDLLRHLGEAIASPRITAQILEAARRRAVASGAADRARAESLARSTLFGSLFEGHSYGALTDETSLDRVEPDAVRHFLEVALRGRRSVVALVGGTDAASAMELAGNALGRLAPGGPWLGSGEPAPADRRGRSQRIHRSIAQSQVATGIATVAARHADFHPLQLAARLLWGRLFSGLVRGGDPIAYWLWSISPRAWNRVPSTYRPVSPPRTRSACSPRSARPSNRSAPIRSPPRSSAAPPRG